MENEVTTHYIESLVICINYMYCMRIYAYQLHYLLEKDAYLYKRIKDLSFPVGVILLHPRGFPSVCVNHKPFHFDQQRTNGMILATQSVHN